MSTAPVPDAISAEKAATDAVASAEHGSGGASNAVGSKRRLILITGRRADVWKHWGRLEGAKPHTYTCLYCKKTLSAKNTTNLRRHTAVCAEKRVKDASSELSSSDSRASSRAAPRSQLYKYAAGSAVTVSVFPVSHVVSAYSM